MRYAYKHNITINDIEPWYYSDVLTSNEMDDLLQDNKTRKAVLQGYETMYEVRYGYFPW